MTEAEQIALALVVVNRHFNTDILSAIWSARAYWEAAALNPEQYDTKAEWAEANYNRYDQAYLKLVNFYS